MKSCDHCGAQNPDEAKFCRECGSPFAATVPADAEKTTVLPADETMRIVRPAAGDAVPGDAAPIVEEDRNADERSRRTPPEEPAPAADRAQYGYGPSTASASNVPYGVPQYQYQQPDYQAQGYQTPGYRPAPGYQTPAYGDPRYARQGAPVPGGQPPQQNRPYMPYGAQPDRRPGAAGEFFMWVWESFKHPSRAYRTQTWWAVIPFVVEALLMALSVYLWEVNLANFGGGLWSHYSGYGAYGSGVSIGELFKGWIIYALLLYVVVLICFMGIKMMGDGRSFAALHTMLAQKMMPLLLLNAVSALCALIGNGLIVLSVILFMLGISYVVAVPGAVIAQAESTRTVDKTWIWILAVFLGGLILCLFLVLMGAVGVMGVMSSVGSMLDL